jgi:hypothetical protein
MGPWLISLLRIIIHNVKTNCMICEMRDLKNYMVFSFYLSLVYLGEHEHCRGNDVKLSLKLLIWGFNKSLQLDPTKTLPWRTKIIYNSSPSLYAYNKTRTRNINHNKIVQSLEEFASSIKNLVWESLNHTKRSKSHNMWQLQRKFYKLKNNVKNWST